jgi:C4-type Zn-finger protein
MPFRALLAGTSTSVRGHASADRNASYRRCPKCGERDLRLSDRQRANPYAYQSRIYALKWLCLSCGHRENETIEETE